LLQSDPFHTLARSIISQQISTKAAASIGQRLLDLVAPRPFAPKVVLQLGEEDLRSCGLSRAKAVYLQDLAHQVHSGNVTLDTLQSLEDEDVIAALTQIKGIGRWTAEMFLIFSLGRPDVLPVDDLGLRAGIQRCDGLDEMPTKSAVRARGAIWQPYRSVATWYLWRWLGLLREEAKAARQK
jgi:DNA-3-methyladenine glycosylase II